jgi:hypothetical protein
MNLATTIELYGGGQGSGCKGENCGRPRTREVTMPRGRQSLERIDAELKEAAKRSSVVLMEYRIGDSEKSKTFLIAPYSYRGDRFFGYDMTQKGIRAFKMMNIVRVQQTAKKFKPKWKVELAARVA